MLCLLNACLFKIKQLLCYAFNFFQFIFNQLFFLSFFPHLLFVQLQSYVFLLFSFSWPAFSDHSAIYWCSERDFDSSNHLNTGYMLTFWKSALFEYRKSLKGRIPLAVSILLKSWACRRTISFFPSMILEWLWFLWNSFFLNAMIS
jgi:hypothetical protein